MEINKEPSEQEMSNYLEKLINKFKLDPQWELMQEFGKFLMRDINDLSVEERKRYDELKELLKTK